MKTQHCAVSKSEDETTVDPSWAMLDKIMNNVSYLEEQLCEFQGVKGCKHYRLLEEKFTQKLVALDDIDTKGSEFIRQQRKESIKAINDFLRILESKAQKQSEKSNTVLSDMTNVDVNNHLEDSSASSLMAETGQVFSEGIEITPQIYIRKLKNIWLENGCFAVVHF